MIQQNCIVICCVFFIREISACLRAITSNKLCIAIITNYALHTQLIVHYKHKKRTVEIQQSFFVYLSDFLLSRAASRQVSSALRSLTSVFGMGTGVSSALLPLSFNWILLLTYLTYLPIFLLFTFCFRFLLSLSASTYSLVIFFSCYLFESSIFLVKPSAY